MSGLLLWLSKGIAQAPVPDFSATPTSGCGPLTVQFEDLSTNKPLFWSWDFGNGTVASSQNPSVTYVNPGTYTVKLIVRNTSGSNATIKTNYITVYPYPSPKFTSNLTLACAPVTVQFTDQSTAGQGAITSWTWDFGDGSNSGQQNPAHTYTQNGYYNVGLKVTNSGGCSYATSVPRYLRVVSGVQANFTFNQSSASCTAPFTGQLLNQSAGPGNLTYSWTMSNGATPPNSSDTSPVVTFPNSGQYNVNLQVTSSLGCSASTQQTLNFSNGAAVINGPTTACVNTPATFSDGSSPAPGSIVWDFGDGTSSNVSSVSKTYTTTGSYTVKLTNKYAACTESATQTVQVVNPPIANFTTNDPTNACKAPLTIHFIDQTSPTPTGWLWDFGDGQTSTAQNPVHTYTSTGAFTVTLTATGAGNCPNSIVKNNFITIQSPTVSIAGTLTACTAATATFNTINPTATVNSVDGTSSYSWNAPGSNEGSSTSATPTFTYASSGSYNLSVTVTTNGGCTVSGTTTVQIGTPLVPDFTVSPALICNYQQVTFQSTTPGPPQNWVWDFGDHTGVTVSGTSTATHQYGFYGLHNVTLTVYNNGCPQQKVEVVNIHPPYAFFKYALDATAGCANKFLLQFTDTSFENTAYGPISWSWNFGDPASGANNTSTLQNPEHQYPDPGATPVTYNVTLTITNGSCSDSRTIPVTIANITPSFTSSPSGTACRNQIVTYTSTSSPANLVSTYSWTVDGGMPSAPSTSPTFQTTFTSNGPHTVGLTITDINGCTYNAPASAIQITGPTALFTAPATGGGCTTTPTTFTDGSTPDPATNPITTWSWNFDDGNFQTYPPAAPPFTHQFTDTGFYQPNLTVIDAAGCRDSYSGPQIQITSPLAKFSGPDSFYCPGVPLTFTDSSQGYGLTENWNFGDGSGPSTTPVHSFPNSGQTYTVTLTVTDKHLCTNTTTGTVNIQKPIAAFNIYDTTAICVPMQAIFAAHGQYYDSLYWNFGDGTTSTLDSTSHFYNNYGIDTAKLFLQGPGGCLDSAYRRVLVTNPYTTTGFTYSPLSACDSVPVQFNLTPPSYTLFTLDFGDHSGDSSQNLSPFHMYRNPGGYLPILTLADETGCVVNIGGASGITVLGATPFFSVSNHTFCDSGTVVFTDFTISNNGFASETYTFGDGSPGQTLSPGNGNFDPSHDYIKAGLWTATLQVSTASGCTESYSDTIHIYQTPHASIIIPVITCTGQIQFQGSLTVPEPDSVSWAWAFGNGQTSKLQNPDIQMAPGNYTVTLKTSVPFGCSDTTSSPITVNPLPQIKGPHEISTPVGIPVTIPFTYSPNVNTWNWTPANNLDCPTCANPAATLIYAATYSVTVTDANSCSATDTILIKTICNDKNYWFPNTFSPNGDGVNDYFYPRGTSLYNIQSLTIFNRWGQMVYQRRDFPANDQSMGWDGTFAGKPAPADAYVYIAQVVCENAQVVVLNGNVTLIR